MSQLSKNEQTEINLHERVSSTSWSAQRCSSMVHTLEAAAVEIVHTSTTYRAGR